MRALSDDEKSYKTMILSYLEQFEWEPDSIQETEDQITITLIAHLDIKEVKILVRFSENSHWIYFSALFLPTIKRNREAIYGKLLELNYSTNLTKFGMNPQKNIYALIELPLDTLDFSEFSSALRRLTNDINKYLIPIATLLQEEKS
ncbi:MAG: YbjN domain-containing protein [Candidatus Kariarchaeaceae archaeon]|jgi:hypothetical protein